MITKTNYDYQKKYKLAHPDRVKASIKKWKQANKEHVKEYQKKYRVRARINNPELKTKSDTKTYYKHREERLAKDRIYRNENRELLRERANSNGPRYRESHKEEITARSNLNHAVEKGLVEKDQMNKKWEKDLLKYCDVFDTKDGAYLREDNVRDFIDNELAKQRTQILARVREEVIGELVETKPSNDIQLALKVALELKRDLQLKKLKIISEEVK